VNFAHAPAALIARALAAPLHPDDIHWMLIDTGISDKKPWARAVCYANADALRKRLDAVLGIDGWSSTLEVVHSDRRVIGMKCRLEARVGGVLVHREDVAPLVDAQEEPLKACATNAFKRAALSLCCAAYLRSLDPVAVKVEKKAAWRGEHRQDDGSIVHFRWELPDDHWHRLLDAYLKGQEKLQAELDKLTPTEAS
jgi:hypothetical protein